MSHTLRSMSFSLPLHAVSSVMRARLRTVAPEEVLIGGGLRRGVERVSWECGCVDKVC